MKFGGTSIGTSQAIQQVIENVRKTRQEWERVVIVTSAVAGVTNLLVESAERAISGDEVFISQAERELIDKHLGMVEELIPSSAQRAQLKQEIKHLVTEFGSVCRPGKHSRNR